MNRRKISPPAVATLEDGNAAVRGVWRKLEMEEKRFGDASVTRGDSGSSGSVRTDQHVEFTSVTSSLHFLPADILFDLAKRKILYHSSKTYSWEIVELQPPCDS